MAKTANDLTDLIGNTVLLDLPSEIPIQVL